MSETRPGWSVRSATAADLEELLAIEAAWPTSPGWTREHFQAELHSERSFLCVATDGERVLGFASMKLVPPEAQVFNIAVRLDHARQGLGKKLLERLHEEARRLGCTTSTLEVKEGNLPALALYQARGYRVVGRRPNYYNDGAAALLMEAPL